MCLGVPGKIVKLYTKENTRMANVDFSGVKLDVCLEATPEAVVGDYVIVHAGFAISRLDEKEALETLSMLDEIDELNRQEAEKQFNNGN